MKEDQIQEFLDGFGYYHELHSNINVQFVAMNSGIPHNGMLGTVRNAMHGERTNVDA